jgi:hypothetical protein
MMRKESASTIFINLGAASKAPFSKNPRTAGGILAPPATTINDGFVRQDLGSMLNGLLPKTT